MFVRLGYKHPNGVLQQKEIVEATLENMVAHLEKHNYVECYCTYPQYDIRDQNNACIVAPLVFDIDNEEDPNVSRLDSIKLIKKLQKDGLSLDDIDIYFSGHKGFHIIIPREVIAMEPK